MYGNTPLPENTTDNFQFWDYSTIKIVRLDKYSELKYDSGELIGPVVPHVINQVNLKEKIFVWVTRHMWM